MINKVKGHFEEVDGNKYLIISSENGDIMQKYQEVFDGIKEIIKNTDGNIILNKIICFPTITITIRSVTQKDD